MITEFNYEGTPIRFGNGENGCYVNATEMAKKFGKKTHDWMRLPSTIEFINELTEARKSLFVDTQLVITKKGGVDLTHQGTWFHEDVALEFARWLSPKFAIWCNSKIKELLTTGKTTINEEPTQKLPKTYLEALEALVETEKKRLLLEQVNSVLVPKAEVYDEVMGAKDGNVSISEAAKLLNIKGIGQRNLFKILREKNILMSNNKPYQNQIEMGNFVVKETTIRKGQAVYVQTFVTQKGLEYLIKRLKTNEIAKV